MPIAESSHILLGYDAPEGLPNTIYAYRLPSKGERVKVVSRKRTFRRGTGKGKCEKEYVERLARVCEILVWDEC